MLRISGKKRRGFKEQHPCSKGVGSFHGQGKDDEEPAFDFGGNVAECQKWKRQNPESAARLALVGTPRRAYAFTMSDFTPTERTQVKRLPKRGKYDTETVYKILDEAFVCHVGFAVDAQPYVIPTNFGRAGDTLYLHGSAASRMLRTLSQGIPVCVTVTLVDGLVLARSAFHHSVNYR